VRLDRRRELALLPLADDAAARLVAGIPETRRDDCWWLVLRDATPVPGDAGGGVALFAELRLTRPLGRFLRAVGAGPLIDALDKLVSCHRGRLGKLVPDGPAPRRYP
jgi:hypothetical protein